MFPGLINFLNRCHAHLHLSLPHWCHKSMPFLYMLPHCTPNWLTCIPHAHIHQTNNHNVAHAPTTPTLQILHRTRAPPWIDSHGPTPADCATSNPTAKSSTSLSSNPSSAHIR